MCFYFYAKDLTKSKQTIYAIGAMLLTSSLVFLNKQIPVMFFDCMVIVMHILNFTSRGPQIIMNYQNKNTGNLSFSSKFLAVIKLSM